MIKNQIPKTQFLKIFLKLQIEDIDLAQEFKSQDNLNHSEIIESIMT